MKNLSRIFSLVLLLFTPVAAQTTVQVTLRSYSITMQTALPAGKITFIIVDSSVAGHDFAVRNTSGVVLGQSRVLSYNQTDTLTLTLASDVYIAFCTESDENGSHESKGMIDTLSIGTNSVKEPPATASILQLHTNPVCTEADFRVDPNPVPRMLLISNLLGRIVASAEVSPGVGRLSVPVTRMLPGVYWCRLESENVKLLVVR